MNKTLPRSELDILLTNLQDRLPSIVIANIDNGDFWCEFTGAADIVLDSTSDTDYQWAQDRLDAMLRANGKIPD